MEEFKREDAFSCARVMWIVDDNFKWMFLGSMSWVRPAPEKHGLPVPSGAIESVQTGGFVGIRSKGYRPERCRSAHVQRANPQRA